MIDDALHNNGCLNWPKRSCQCESAKRAHHQGMEWTKGGYNTQQNDVLICVTSFRVRPNFKPLCRRLNLRIRIVPMSPRRGAIPSYHGHLLSFSCRHQSGSGTTDHMQSESRKRSATRRAARALAPSPVARLFSARKTNSVLVHNLHPSPLGVN
jgi:hypothetical protein